MLQDILTHVGRQKYVVNNYYSVIYVYPGTMQYVR